jgi:WD40 repeat protein
MGISWSPDQSLRAWDFQAGTCLRVLMDGEHDRAVAAAAAVTADGRWAFSASERTIYTWDVSRALIVSRCSAFKSPLSTMALSPDGFTLLTGHQDGTMLQWRLQWALDRATGEEALPAAIPVSEETMELARKARELVDAHEGAGAFRALSGAACRPDFRHAPGTFDTRRALMRGGRRGSPGKQWLSGICRADEKECTALAAGISLAVTGGRDGELRCWSLPEGRLLATPGRGEAWGSVCNLAFSSDETTVIALFRGLTVRHVDVESGKCLSAREIRGDFSAVSMSADGKVVATVAPAMANRREIHVWREGAPAVLTGHLEEVREVSLGDDGSFLLSCDDAGMVKLWDTRARVSLMTWDEKEYSPRGLRPGRGGEMALWSTGQGVLRYWKRAAGREVKTLSPPDGADHVTCAPVFSRCGTMALAGGRDRIRLWNLATGFCPRVIPEHGDMISRVQMTPDGLCFLAVSADAVMKIWTVE